MIGIYKITSPSGRIYIGQSVNIEDRFRHYKTLDCKGQSKIYNSLKKYGVDNHIFEVVEECEVSFLTDKEGYWQDFYNCTNEGLNCRRVTTSDKTGYDSKETVEKRKQSLKGKSRPDIQGEKHFNYGKTMSKKHRKIMSDSAKNRTGFLSPSSELVICLETGIFYPSMLEAGIAYNLSYKQVRSKLKGVNINNTFLILVEDFEKGLFPKDTKIKKEITKGLNPNAKKVKDFITGEIFTSIVEAAEKLNIKERILRDMLRGKQKNKTNLIYE